MHFPWLVKRKIENCLDVGVKQDYHSKWNRMKRFLFIYLFGGGGVLSAFQMELVLNVLLFNISSLVSAAFSKAIKKYSVNIYSGGAV